MLERGNWTILKRPRRWLPWGRWRGLARLWLAAKADRRMEAIRARKRSMDMARGITRGGQAKLYSREAGRPCGAHSPARGGSTPPPATKAVTAGRPADWPR